MSKSVLISICPEWCEKILSGEKTLEIRKNRPKIEPPFHVYIYCTQGKKVLYCSNADNHIRLYNKPSWAAFSHHTIMSGKVIARFTCDAILPISVTYSDPNHHLALREFPGTCLTDKQIIDYLGNGGGGYAWHISDLVIYDEPRDLSAFRRHCINDLWCESCAMYSTNRETCNNASVQITRPPQSWSYVEDQPY